MLQGWIAEGDESSCHQEKFLESLRTRKREKMRRDKEIQKAVVSKLRFPCPSEAILEHVPCPMLDGTLERSGQCLGVELSQCAWQLCPLKISQIEVRSNCRLDRNNDRRPWFAA